MFKVIIHLRDVATETTFNSAFKIFFAKIIESARQGTSFQALETTNFITFDDGEITHVMDFEQVRHAANVFGLVEEGALVEDAPEPDTEEVIETFRKVTAERAAAELEAIIETINTASSCLEAAVESIRESRSSPE